MFDDEFWAHGPIHKLDGRGVYMVTAGTYLKEHFVNTSDKLNLVQNTFFELSVKYGWQPQSWAFLINHYHFIARSPETAQNLSVFLAEFHQHTAHLINEIDVTPNRKVWFQFWDKHLTYQKSYLARLKYVNTNPVHHKLVVKAEDYDWCSAARSFQHTVNTFKIDNLNEYDEF